MPHFVRRPHISPLIRPVFNAGSSSTVHSSEYTSISFMMPTIPRRVSVQNTPFERSVLWSVKNVL